MENDIKIELPDFDLVANMMVEEGVQIVSPSELHGLLCGHLVAGGRPDAASLLKHACDLMDIGELQNEASKVAILQIFEQSQWLLEEENLSFALLLPDDDAELSQRAQALGQWCNGFLAGFGLYGSQSDDSLSREAQEALSDVALIAQVVVGEEDGDGSEGDLIEVGEYVRTVVMMVFAECNKPSAEPAEAPVVH
ncbi:MAG: UPF0149 family protein [Pontibacterium sp.]